MKKMILQDTGISMDGWAKFFTLLCDTSSVNNTYLSNHTLENLGASELLINLHTLLTSNPDTLPMPADVHSRLALNRSGKSKGQVAMIKILQHHSHFDMQPFFAWEFKVLPLIINWFTKAKACTTEFDEQISKMKLSCMYDFVREFPMLYIEPVTRKEIEECSAMEEQLLGDEAQNAKLKQVQERKTRAMRRLF